MVLASLIYWGPPLQLGFTNSFSQAPFMVPSLTLILCMISSILDCQLQLRLHFYQWPSMDSHSVKPQLFFMTLSGLQNQYQLGDSYILPSTAAAWGTTLAISRTQFFVLSENSSQKISPQWCWSLLNHRFLAPANQTVVRVVSFFSWIESQSQMTKAAKFCCLHNWNMAPVFYYIITRFLFSNFFTA